MSTPPDAPPGAMSIGDLNSALKGGGAAPPPSGPPRAYSPNPDAPIPPGYVRGEYTADGGPRKSAAPEGAMSAEQMNELLRPKSAAPAGPQKGPGLAHTFLEGLNQVVAETLGIPGSVAAHIIAPKIWNEATEEQREKLRKENPRESAIMDYLSRSSKQTEETVGQTGVKNLFDKINVTGKGNEPVTRGEQATFAGGRMAGSVAVPGVGADAALASTWKEGAVMADGLSTITGRVLTKSAGETSLGPLGDVLGQGAAKSNLVGGAAAGTAGEAARQKAPDDLKDVAETGAGFGAGGIAGIGTSFMEKLFSSVGASLRKIVEPAYVTAARTLRDRGGPTVARDVNEAATAPPLVEGSQPSLYQASGNPRVGVMEGEARRTEHGKLAFAEQEKTNNAARMRELQSLRDPDAKEGAVTSYLRSRLDQITDEQAARVQDAMEQARTAHEAAGGVAVANPSEYAEQVRPVLDRLNKEARARESKLWDAVSEDRDTRVPTDTLQSTNRKMAFNIGRYAKQPEGEEAEVRDIIKNLGKTVSFGDLTDIRSRITTILMDMRAGANPNRQEFARLSQTLRSIDDTLLNSVKMNAKKEGPRSAMIDKLEAAAKAEDAQRAAVEGTDVGATRVAANEGGREPGASPGETAPVGRVPEGEVPPAVGEGGEGRAGPRAAERGTGIQGREEDGTEANAPGSPEFPASLENQAWVNKVGNKSAKKQVEITANDGNPMGVSVRINPSLDHMYSESKTNNEGSVQLAHDLHTGRTYMWDYNVGSHPLLEGVEDIDEKIMKALGLSSQTKTAVFDGPEYGAIIKNKEDKNNPNGYYQHITNFIKSGLNGAARYGEPMSQEEFDGYMSRLHGAKIVPEEGLPFSEGEFVTPEKKVPAEPHDTIERDNLQVIGPAANDVLPPGQTTNEKYGAARGATAERKGNFERGVVGGVLRPGATPGTFRMLADNVMRAVFDSPERLAATIKAGTKDGKLDPDLETNLKDYAAFSLKKAAGKEAGLLSPAKFQKWVDDHGYVLDQFPDLRAKFADMKTAQGSLDQAVADQKAALSDFQSRAVKRLVHDGEEPRDIVAKTIGKPEFGEVTRQVAHDPDAAAGWKRAVVEHVVDLATSVKETGGSGEKQLAGDRLEKFLRDNASDLGAVFDKDELDSMNRVAADFRQGQRKMTGAPDKQPGTFLRVLSSVWTGRAVGAALGAEAGMHGGHLSAGALVGMLAAEGVQRVAAGRAAAAKDALTDMLLDPKKANLWLEKIPPGTDWKDWAGPLSRRLGALYSGEMEKEIKEHGDQQ